MTSDTGLTHASRTTQVATPPPSVQPKLEPPKRIEYPVEGIGVNMSDRAGRFRWLALLLAGSAVSWAPQTPDAHAIVAKSLDRFNISSRLELQYTHEEEIVTRQFDAEGHAKSTKSEIFEVTFLGGKEYRKRIARDGKPLPAAEAQREQSRIDRAAAEASHLGSQDLEKRQAAAEAEQTRGLARIRPVLEADVLRVAGSEPVDGRPAWIIDVSPKENYHGPYSNLYRNIQARIWIDQADYQWVRVEATTLHSIAFGLFLASVAENSHISFEQMRLNEEIWLPKRIKVRASARALVKHVNLEQEILYRNYRKFQSKSRITSFGEAK